jgi:hypothetical protein
MAVIEVLLMYGADVTRVMAQGIPQPCWRNSSGHRSAGRSYGAEAVQRSVPPLHQWTGAAVSNQPIPFPARRSGALAFPRLEAPPPLQDRAHKAAALMRGYARDAHDRHPASGRHGGDNSEPGRAGSMPFVAEVRAGCRQHAASAGRGFDQCLIILQGTEEMKATVSVDPALAAG